MKPTIEKIKDIIKRIPACPALDELQDIIEGEGAIGWFVNANADDDPNGPHFQQVAKQYEGTEGTFPLFQFPTLPEGMALVPVEPEWQPCGKCDELHRELVVQKGMLKIARAEREALQTKATELEQQKAQLEAELFRARETRPLWPR